MTAIDFPNSPAVDDVFTVGEVSFKWTGTAWISNTITLVDWSNIDNVPTSFTPSAHAASHGSAGADSITIAASQVTGLDAIPIATSQVTGLADFVRTLPAEISSKTGAYTLVAGDTNDLIQANGTFTITVPANTIPTGARVDIVNTGTGVITIAGSGLTIQSKNSSVTIDERYAGATLFFTSNTTALLVGDLA